MPSYGKEFQEIGHCGGQFTISVKTAENGHRSVQFGWHHSRPNPAAIFAVYALPQGIPVGIIQLGGIGQPWNPAPTAGCWPIFIASDSLGMFGHYCQNCGGYWRSDATPSRWKTTCPYCGFHAESHAFLTEGQIKYIEACTELIEKALTGDEDGEFALDMDQVADMVGKSCEKPKFYYVEESQQNKYKCPSCGANNDILGRYGYCSSCGTHNGLHELELDITSIREKTSTGQHLETCCKDAVGAFDSFARQIAKQLALRIPMTSSRKNHWERKLFHNLRLCADDLAAVFDINVFKGLKPDDISFAILMFHRRHVYEHNGGEVDEKYIRDSGDTSVRVKQVIRESPESASRIAEIVLTIAGNIHHGFHEIFPPEDMPISFHVGRSKRVKKASERSDVP